MIHYHPKTRNAIAKIQLYIHIVKGVEVVIEPDFNSERENQLFMEAYRIADDYLRKNMVQVTYMRDNGNTKWRRHN